MEYIWGRMASAKADTCSELKNRFSPATDFARRWASAGFARRAPASTATFSTWRVTFVVEIEAKLIVHAFDEESARKKVEKAFASGRAGWTYVVVPQQNA